MLEGVTMTKIDRYIVQQKKLLAKLRKARDAANKSFDKAGVTANKADNIYLVARGKAADKIAKAKDLQWWQAVRLLGD